MTLEDEKRLGVGAGERVHLVCAYICVHLLFLSITVNSESPTAFPLFPPGAHRDFGVWRGSCGLGPLGTDGHLRTIPRRMLFSLCASVDLYFSLDAFSLL